MASPSASTAARRVRSALPWLAWCAVLVAAGVLTGFAAAEAHLRGDVTTAREVQDLSFPGLDALSRLLYDLGTFPARDLIALTALVLLVARGRRLLALFVLLAAQARIVTALLKDAVERPRPSPELVDVSEHAGGFSFPSGHVLGTVVLWGFLAFAASEAIPSAAPRRAVQAVAVIVIALMGVQRVYAGAHWPSDALGGYLWGAALLFALVAGYRFVHRRLA